MKSIIAFALLLPFVLAINLQEDEEFLFVDDNKEPSSVLSSVGVLTKDYAGQHQTNVGESTNQSKELDFSKKSPPKKYFSERIGHSMHDHYDKKNKYLNLKKHGVKNHQKEKRSLGSQRQVRRNAEHHLKKQSRNIRSNEESHRLTSNSKKNYRKDSFRDRREAGSGYGDEEDNYDLDPDDADDENYDDQDEYDQVGITEQSPKPIVPSATENRGFSESDETGHPHRHGHDKESIDIKPEEKVDEGEIVPVISPKVEEAMNNITSSLSTTPAPQLIPESTELPTTSIQSSTTISPAISTTTENVTEKMTVVSSTTLASTTTSSTTTTTTTTTTTPEPTTIIPTTPSTTTSTTTTTTTSTTPEPIKTIDFGVKNYPPRQDRRLKKIPVTAGKLLSYVIPANTFSDLEDGDTRNLKLSLHYKGNQVKTTHWLQFNSKTQEVYGLPLESDVSVWDYDLVASDSEGLNVSDSLDIYVQQHKLSRSVSYDFSIYLRIDKRTEFPTNVDWQKRVVENLSKLYGDKDTSEITVRSIDIVDQDQAIFTWTNDSIPRSNDCPKNEINKLLSLLIANEDGDPSSILQNALSPEIRVKRVVSQGFGQCETLNLPDAPKGTTSEPKVNERPMPRNQVDHINATVGQLLVFKVPDDTFYDREDGSARNMQMSLLTFDRMPIPPGDWLQFDSKNQEFYGIPLKEDLQQARREYQLVVTDKDGDTANDGLVVQLHPAPEKNHSVEFSMTLDVPYNSFAHSASQKRMFIEKLAELFNDKDTSMISLKSINEGSTVVTWRNNTLSTDLCPNDEIIRLMSVLSKSDKTVSERVYTIMSSDFPVVQINRTPLGKCLGQMTSVYNTDNYVIPSGNSKTVNRNIYDDYLITFILPIIIIAAMILFSGIIALVLYRRRRSGKMSVCEHDDERQSFRSKGIPVIFQDELEEKPDPGNKSPVILKEEKPPLPPPEYQKSDDGADEPMLPKGNSEEPYQPPPPFARNSDNNRQNRPKPTPTYRKPPPYVPP